MNARAGFDRFQEAILELSSTYMKPMAEATLHGKELSRPTDSAYRDVFEGFTEISDALEALSLTEVLVGVSPPRSTRVKKDKYLNFLVGAYLQEVYILEQRLVS